MAFDFKKEYKEFYMPKNKPEIVNVPKANYIAVRGKGNPDEYEPWQKALMCAVGQKCDWTDKSYLEPLLKYIEEL